MSTLQVRIVSPTGELFKDDVLAVSSKNSAGNFDVLPGHANFVTMIQNVPISVTLQDKSKKVFKYPLAILHAGSERVDIYTDVERLS